MDQQAGILSRSSHDEKIKTRSQRLVNEFKMEKKGNERSVSAFNNELKLKGFNAFQIEDDAHGVRNYSRKDFYKICLTTGESIINYADRSYVMKGTILFFANPNVPYSWETISRSYVGYTCLFSEDFL